MSEENIFDNFLNKNENEKSWIKNYNKKQCPECFALHDTEEEKCSVCGWSTIFKKP